MPCTHTKKKPSTETDKMQAGAKHHTDYRKKPHRRVQVTARAATQKLETRPCHLHQIHFLELLLFFPPLSLPLSLSLSLSPHSATFGRIEGQQMHFLCTTHAFYRLPETCTAAETRKDMHKYLVSRLQILSCEYSYNIKGWCSLCLPPVGPPLPGRFVHFWVLLQAQYSNTHTQRDTDRRTDILQNVCFSFSSFFFIRGDLLNSRLIHGARMDEFRNVVSAHLQGVARKSWSSYATVSPKIPH